MGTVQMGTDLSDGETSAITDFLDSLTGALPKNFAVEPVLPPAGFIPPPAGSDPPREK